MAKTAKSMGSKSVSFRADVAVADAISEAAEARGMSPSDFIRTVMLKVLKSAKGGADVTAAKVKALSPDAQKKVVRARVIIKELATLRASRPAASLLDDIFQDGDGEEIAGKIQALELELAVLKKAIGKEIPVSKAEEDNNEEDGDEEGGGEKTNAEENADGLLGIAAITNSLRVFVRKQDWLDYLFNFFPSPSIEDVLIKKFKSVLDGEISDGDEILELQEKSLEVVDKRKEIHRLEASGTDKAVAEARALRKELDSMRDDLLAPVVEEAEEEEPEEEEAEEEK
jgi:antitoxin component of RelBE/YafQ-DinJ toxin-antitoxin module